MGYKVLKDHAHVFCQMFMGWRMAADLNQFAGLPDGMLEIDILQATCDHSEAGTIETHIAGELREWFFHRLREHQISEDEIIAAKLSIRMTKKLPASRKRGIAFDWACQGTIVTKDRSYSAQLAEPHIWIPNK